MFIEGHFTEDVAQTLGGELADILVLVSDKLEVNIIDVLNVIFDLLEQVFHREGQQRKYFVEQVEVLDVDSSDDSR